MADVEENTKTAIEEDGLELSLSLRCSSSSSSVHQQQQPHNKNILEPSSSASNGHQILTKRDAQAIRRHEAKLKRDFKRKASSLAKNDVVGNNNNNDNNHVQEEEDYSVERRRKVCHVGFQAAAPPWLGWNAGGGGGYNGGFMSFQGYNGNFGDGKDGGGGGCAGSLSSGSSSGISDNNNYPGGNSSDAGSHSSHPHLQVSPPNISRPCTTISQPQPCSSQLDLTTNGSNPSQPMKPQLCNSYSNKIDVMSGSRQSSKSPEVVTSSNTTNNQHNDAYSNNEKTVLSDKDPNTTRSSCPKETKGEIGKPPKPAGPTGQQKLIYSNMPCVTTTGNGPNGKTVTGFLCKYSKGEVSIVCVCHGTSFSPAGFVQHAGGVDVEYPLRQIRVALPLNNHLS